MKSQLRHPGTWPLRWRYAASSFLVGVAYTLTALALGIQATVRGVDVTLAVGGVIEVSFAVFGFLLGMNAEARLRERLDAEIIETQLRDLASARSRLAQSEKLASLGELAGAVVHEVRNPLAIIRSMAQNLEEALAEKTLARKTVETEVESPDPLEICRHIRDEIDRLARVTSSLSAFSRRPRLRPRPVNVAQLVARVRLLASELLERRGIELRLEAAKEDADCEDVMIEADEDLLAQVLLGLVENAAEASPDGVVVHLGRRRREDMQELTVSDDGPGVPDELRERIFDPFFTTRAEGHGLGLAVARQIVRAHGGDIEAVPCATGATFRLRLPAKLPAKQRVGEAA